ncbi:MAG: hypothetical protein TQ37_04810 [Candidatus Synechococcus spongiarum 15L]|uniref:DUF2232 domain-containing protein n=1 Tax=Candidatus Synechococcus spongiarum 15L TaxID=1608419 RepID=A0A0G8AVI1_9SYNE|nr:MAG: hypothetical protein TQ37_04810 [Candidatus Synechococcus spongiarum 15L]
MTWLPPSLRSQALKWSEARRITDTAYLAAATGLLFLALYYLPVGGPLLRLALPLPLAMLQLRHGRRSGLMGAGVVTLLLSALMGPIRGPLVLFPYGFLGIWLGWCWNRGLGWCVSWSVGTLVGSLGFVIRVAVLSLLLGSNLWVVFTNAAVRMLDWLLGILEPVLGLSLAPTIAQVQVMAAVLILLQNIVYTLTLHIVSYWIFPRLHSPISEPPDLLRPLVALDPL